MRVYFQVIIVILFCLFGFPGLTFSQNLSSSTLINHAQEYDAQTVIYSGEVIGDIMLRGEFAWLNIHDGEHALGVWVKSAIAKTVQFTGNYKTRGDILEITGILNRACLQHGGELDIHAQIVRKVSPGRIVKEKLNFDKVRFSFILLGALLFIWTLTLFKHK